MSKKAISNKTADQNSEDDFEQNTDDDDDEFELDAHDFEHGADDETAKIIEFLITSCANLEARNSYNETPLLVAAQKSNNFGILAYLLSCGACIDAVDDEYNGIYLYLSKEDFIDLNRYTLIF